MRFNDTKEEELKKHGTGMIVQSENSHVELNHITEEGKVGYKDQHLG